MMADYVVVMAALWVGCLVYTRAMERRPDFAARLAGCSGLFLLVAAAIAWLGYGSGASLSLLLRLLMMGLVALALYSGWKLAWSAAIYYTLWVFLHWQLLYGLWLGLWPGAAAGGGGGHTVGLALLYVLGYLLSGLTVAKWVPGEVGARVGPRQLSLGLILMLIFEGVDTAVTGSAQPVSGVRWAVLYLSQVLLVTVFYLQMELFKKSAMRQELAVMDLLWRKSQEQYRLSRENIALINQKCHDLKHQINAIRTLPHDELDAYLSEMEDTVRIYEAIVKTGNEALDTILTEKSLFCKEHGIVVVCAADGSQLSFLNTVDLYTILGNALDNAIEAVSQFREAEKRQIEVTIFRQQCFLVVHVVNPSPQTLVFQEGLPVTTKEDAEYHGFGLRSIRHIVKKYDGNLCITDEDGYFFLKILIPIPQAT